MSEAKIPADFELHPQLAADSHPVADLDLCELRLIDDRRYPWLVLIPRVAGATELIDLEAAQRPLLSNEIDIASRLLRDVFAPDKLNVAALGNQVPQLHVHVIGRFRNDPAWPKPIWGQFPAQPYTDAERSERIALLKDRLQGVEFDPPPSVP